MLDGAGVATEDGDEVEVGVVLAVGFSVWDGFGVPDGCSELVADAGLVGLTADAEVVGVTVGVVEGVVGEMAEGGVGLTQL